MVITYRDTDYSTLEDCRSLAKWFADPAIRHLAVPQRDESHSRNPDTAEQIQSRERSGPFSPEVDRMILQDGHAIGHCSIIFDPPHRITREGKVGWFGITIGEKEFRARGIGRKTMLYLEDLALKRGASCVEAGVFEFNEPSLRMCLALGYEEIGRKEGFTYWNGKFWADIRLLKYL